MKSTYNVNNVSCIIAFYLFGALNIMPVQAQYQDGETFIVGKYAYCVTNSSQHEVEIAGYFSDESPYITETSPNGYHITGIGDYAFLDCSKIRTVNLPSSIVRIGDYAFDGCQSLSSIEIPESVTYIGHDAFRHCYSLKSITIPRSVTYFGQGIFFNCDYLTEVNLPDNMTSIPLFMFKYCQGLEYLDIPDGVTKIEDDAFRYCTKLKEITIPQNVTQIGNSAFRDCRSLSNIRILSAEPPVIDENTFEGISPEAIMYVPDEAVDKYKSSPYWSGLNIKGAYSVEVSSIILNTTAITINKNSQEQLYATILPENASDKSIVWTSDNEEVATVDENGQVTAVGVGEANITAIAADGSGVTATCKVTVTPKLVTSVTLDQSELTIERTYTAQLSATIAPEDADNRTVSWTSDNEEVATVDENGQVTAVGVGEANITATAADGSGITATCKVTVTPKLVTSVTLDESELTIEKTYTAQLSATITPDDADNRTVTWTSDNEEVATVDENGLVTAVSVGEANITATAVDGSGVTATCKVTVTPKLVTSVILDESELTIEKNFTEQLTATVAPDDADNLSLTWTSDNEEVATVDENGLVTAVGEGTATITATANDGSGVSASCVVTVTFIDGIADIETSKVTVLAANGRITVSGKEKDDTVSVYDTGGRLLYQGESDVIDVPRKAMYIVTVSGKSYKVIVP